MKFSSPQVSIPIRLSIAYPAETDRRVNAIQEKLAHIYSVCSRIAADGFQIDTEWKVRGGRGWQSWWRTASCSRTALRRRDGLSSKSRSGRLCAEVARRWPRFSSRRFDPPPPSPPPPPPPLTLPSTAAYSAFLKLVDLSSGRAPLTLSDPLVLARRDYRVFLAYRNEDL